MAVLGQYAEAAGINVSKLTHEEIVELDRLIFSAGHRELSSEERKRFNQMKKKAAGK